MEVLELTLENWNRLCDMWANPEHKRRCEINKINRTKLKSNHFMGSRAFVAARAEMGVNEYGEVEPNMIETKAPITRVKKDGHLQRLRLTMYIYMKVTIGSRLIASEVSCIPPLFTPSLGVIFLSYTLMLDIFT